MEGAAVLNRWSVTWKDLSRREEGEAVSEASTWRKSTSGRTSRAKAPMCVCCLCQWNPEETLWQVRSKPGKPVEGISKKERGGEAGQVGFVTCIKMFVGLSSLHRK